MPDALAKLTEILPQEHGGDKLRVLPARLHFFLKLLQRLRRIFRGLTLWLDRGHRCGVVGSSRWVVWRGHLVDSIGVGVDAGVEQLSVFPEDDGVQNGDADRVDLTSGNKQARTIQPKGRIRSMAGNTTRK